MAITIAVGKSFQNFFKRTGPIFEEYARRCDADFIVLTGGVNLPTGYAAFPREILRPPRSAAQRMYTDIRRWSVMPKGGHFAAMEQPEALAREIVEFFRELRPAQTA